MISDKMAERLNKQINVELFASYQYLATSAFCESIALPGFAKFFMEHSEEEREHAMKIYQYLLDQDAAIDLQPVKAPGMKFDSIVDALEHALEHEKKVTKCIHDLVDAAQKEKDHATNVFLNWFVTEQVEEEAVVKALIDRVNLVDNGNGLLRIDQDLGGKAVD